MTRWLLPVLAAEAMHAATIRGITVEYQSGKPLANTLVALYPVPGSSGRPISLRSNPHGAFEIEIVAGSYLVTASRRGFALLHYGQKNWRAAGTPVVAGDGGPVNLRLRLQRYGAVVGTVCDENGVGLPEHDVVAYRNTRPPQMAGKARTDEYGGYRIGGLEPGSYLVRTAAKQDDDEAYLPTFSRETTRIDEAQPAEVALDRDTEAVDLRPFPGRLLVAAGRVQGDRQVPATVALATDMGIETTATDRAGRFQFKPVAPGMCEFYAQAAGDQRTGGTQAGFAALRVDRDTYNVDLGLGGPAELVFTFGDPEGRPVDSTGFQVMVRGKNLSGEGRPGTLALRGARAQLFPGRWDLMLLPGPGYYVAAVSGAGTGDHGRADGWHEIVAGPGPIPLRFVVSPKPGQVHGVVTSPEKAPVAGAPVFLEPYDRAARRRAGDLRFARTDADGRYRFEGLAPGEYRVLSTFEFQAPDAAAMDAAPARLFRAEEVRDVELNLELHVIP